MLRTWFLTVFSLMNSCRAMSRLLRPLATSRSTSISRSVSRGLGTCCRSSFLLIIEANSLSSFDAMDQGRWRAALADVHGWDRLDGLRDQERRVLRGGRPWKARVH